MTRLEFIFDFASPNAYVVHRAMPELVRRTGVKVDYTPVLLGGVFKATGNAPPMMVHANAPAKLGYDNLEFRRFQDRHGIDDFEMNPFFPVNTLLIMRGAIAAQRVGVFEPYVEAVLRHMWVEPKKMDDPEVVRAALDLSGLDGGALIEATNDPEIKAKLVVNTEGAVARGVFGIPTFFFGDQMFFGKERLGQVEEAITSA